MDNVDDNTKLQADRRERLGALSRENSGQRYNHQYSKFIRWAKLVLPIFALVIVAVVLSWSMMSPEVITTPSADDDIKAKQIAKNELLGTKFESRDEKNQPYTITAKRAVQDRNDDDLIRLTEPLADMLLNSGEWVAIESKDGTFSQDTQLLFLENEVRLFHDKGYQMETQSLNIDLENNTAKTQDDVYAFGPRGTLNAKGLEGDAGLEYLNFTGPAKLVLVRSVSNNAVEILP